MTPEEATIQAFVVAPRRGRYLFLLSNPKRRREGLDKLNHCRDLDPRHVRWLGGGEDAVEALLAAGAGAQAYAISGHAAIDARWLPLAEAVHEAAMGGYATLLCCVPGKLAYFYDEVGERRALLSRG